MMYPTNLKLWAHQQEAVEEVAQYFDRRIVAAPRVVPCALVNIPTGGGKTAVIGVLGHWHPKIRNVLVLSPRISIRDQLVRELGAVRGFFAKRGYTAGSLPKKIVALKTSGDVPNTFTQNTIFVSTIQLLLELANSSGSGRTAYSRLTSGCQAVIVDEGHYEPALEWSRVIRKLQRPTVLVTATPYRNDLKAFEIDSDAIYIAKYTELARKHYLRKVDVVQAPIAATKDPAQFVDSVLGTFVKHYGSAPTSTRKLIIRCKAREHIRQIGEIIRAHPSGGGGVLCLHETFGLDKQRPWEVRQPPDPEVPGSPAIWVHQHKLLEGVDGPSFRALAMYGVVGSARALVQQIGRIVRNPKKDKTENALMIDHHGGALNATWERFKAYDTQLSSKNLDTGFQEISHRLERELPAILYVDRDFRTRLILNAASKDEIESSLRLPLRCHLYELGSGSLRRLGKATHNRLMEEDFPFQVVSSNDDELIVLFVTLKNSPLLAKQYFLEPELHVFLALRKGHVVAVLDTSRAGLDAEAALTLGQPLPRSMLARLLAASPDTRLVEVNARSAGLGPSSIRRRSVVAPSLGDTAPTLDEFQFVASSITAIDHIRDPASNDDQFSRRSVGFGLARISDSAKRASLEDWAVWIERLTTECIKLTKRAPIYLDRFAQLLESPPTRPKPKNVLLDLDDARTIFVLNSPDDDDSDEKEDNVPLEIDDVCLDCTPVRGDPAAPRTVSISANGKLCAGSVEYQSGQYILNSDDLERRYRYKDGTTAGNLVKFLNTSQAFVVVPDSSNTIYADGSFYNPGLRTGATFDPNQIGLDDLIEHHVELRGKISEKGKKGSANGSTWAGNSVFRWIDDNPDILIPNAELIICEDGRNESCDFILVGRRQGRDAVLMVHAKASKNKSKVSASALHDVCSQAAKNVGTLALFRPQKPQQISQWNNAWVGPSGEGRVDKRIRRASGQWSGLTGTEIWTKMEALIQRQSTDREVALVLGASLVRNELFKRAKNKNTSARVIQILHLIRSTMSAVVGGGAKLRVLCG